jgi:DNA-directed RNA polymerase specialized sigma24 family protein
VSEVTRILDSVGQGDPKAAEELLPLVYDESVIVEDDQMLLIHEALDNLAQHSKAGADLVKLRYFVGMTLEEAAQALGISARTADNYWAHAKAWLFREIKRQQQGLRNTVSGPN